MNIYQLKVSNVSNRQKWSYAGIFLFIFIWWLVSHTIYANSLFLSTPEEVFTIGLNSLIRGNLISNTIITTVRTILSFVLAITAIPLGLIIGSNKILRESTEPIISFFRSLPSTSLLPLFLLVFGISDVTRIGVSSFISFWILLMITVNGVKHSSQIRLNVAKYMKFNRYQTFKNVILWEALPHIFSGLRVSLPICFIIVIITEMMVNPRNGIGMQIIEAQQSYKVSLMYFLIIFSGFIGLTLSKLLYKVERKIIHWTSD